MNDFTPAELQRIDDLQERGYDVVESHNQVFRERSTSVRPAPWVPASLAAYRRMLKQLGPAPVKRRSVGGYIPKITPYWIRERE
jgi:hypothetical protein